MWNKTFSNKATINQNSKINFSTDLHVCQLVTQH